MDEHNTEASASVFLYLYDKFHDGNDWLFAIILFEITFGHWWNAPIPNH